MEPEIDLKIKSEISQISSILLRTFMTTGKIDLQAICEDEGISIIVDNYQDYFDGILVWDGIRFHIHLNSNKGNLPSSKRGRFTLAHELAHYFIESHREGIKSGNIPLHGSNISLSHSDKMETEADFFAANLLMPADKLRALTSRRKFSMDIIVEVSAVFEVSLTAALLRFKEVGTHEIMIVFSQNNQVKWSFRSHDFPKLANRFKRGDPVPPTTVAGESFIKSNAQYTGVEQIDLEDWFEYRGWEPGRKLYEQCFYSDIFSYAVSLIWFE